ncbi:hypothetical protein CDL15_Pgr012808 [Punica granatum]|uniref:Yippee domain-containing protein n=1 Tax=Punica granatum TaxID=22663 RepID=A0A218XEE6_PUNGR|nr:hypothetical protein CDL15_Pgr012808 [Punica granatum]
MAEFLGNPFFSCRNCRNPLALREDLLNKNFRAKTGQAYMFTNVANIALGRKEDRQLITGNFAIAATTVAAAEWSLDGSTCELTT